MSLDDVLNDIKDDVVNINVTTEGFINTTNALNATNKNDDCKTINLKSEHLPSDLRDKLNTFCNLISIKANIDKLPKVDKAIAVEVFTMLPDLNKSEEAKLTSSPSIINKEVLNNILNTKIDYNVISLLNEKITPIKREMEESRSNINLIKEYLTNFKEVVTSDYTRLLNNPPIVIIDGTSINLLKTNIRDIAFNAIPFDYDKYDSDSILTNKYLILYNDKTLQDYVKLNNIELSLDQIYQKLISDLDSIEHKTSFLNKFIDLTSNLDTNAQANNNLLDIVGNIDTAIEYLMWFKTMFAIVNTKDNFIEKVKNLLAFID